MYQKFSDPSWRKIRSLLGLGYLILMISSGCGVSQLGTPRINIPSDSFQPSRRLAWSPDGERIALVELTPISSTVQSSDAYWQIYVLDIAKSKVSQLTDDATDKSDLAWSPNGSQIAFYAYRPGVESDIHAMGLDGKQSLRLTNCVKTNDYCRDPAWSPNGRQIAYTYIGDPEKKGVYLMDADGRNARRLGAIEGGGLSWSAVHNKIVFHGFGGLKLLDMQNLQISNLTLDSKDRPSEFHLFPTWSPDGQRIVFEIGGNSIFIINNVAADSVQIQLLVSNASSPAWSPDSKTVAFTPQANNCKVATVNFEGSEFTCIYR